MGATDYRPTVEEILGAKHSWYHTIELAPGVVTPGFFDLRDKVDAVGLPRDLAGRRALDVGMFDGFWAFEMERRGAEVVGIDIDVIPPPDTPVIHRARMIAEADGAQPGTGFRLLKSWFGSRVERRSLDVYDLTPDAVGGPVDLALVGSLLLHLRSPVLALERIHDALTADGLLILFEPIDPELSKAKYKEPMARYLAHAAPWTWWYPNGRCLEEWARTAGFNDVETKGTTRVVDRNGTMQVLAAVHARP